MGFFDIFRKKKESKKQTAHEEKALSVFTVDEMPQFDLSEVDVKSVRRQIAEIMMYSDEEALLEANECIFNLTEYKELHKSDYEAYGFDISAANKDALKWAGIADCAVRHGYAVRTNADSSRDEFLTALKGLKCTAELKIKLTPGEEANLSEDGGVIKICEELDALLSDRMICIGAADIGGSILIVFPAEVDKIEELGQLANTIGHRITYAQAI